MRFTETDVPDVADAVASPRRFLTAVADVESEGVAAADADFVTSPMTVLDDTVTTTDAKEIILTATLDVTDVLDAAPSVCLMRTGLADVPDDTDVDAETSRTTFGAADALNAQDAIAAPSRVVPSRPYALTPYKPVPKPVLYVVSAISPE